MLHANFMQMANLQIRDVPEPIHDELRQRAAARGISLRDYMLELILRDQARPSVGDWRESLRSLKPVRTKKSAAELVRASRRTRGA